jgi:hypothetical protein
MMESRGDHGMSHTGWSIGRISCRRARSCRLGIRAGQPGRTWPTSAPWVTMMASPLSFHGSKEGTAMGPGGSR